MNRVVECERGGPESSLTGCLPAGGLPESDPAFEMRDPVRVEEWDDRREAVRDRGIRHVHVGRGNPVLCDRLLVCLDLALFFVTFLIGFCCIRAFTFFCVLGSLFTVLRVSCSNPYERRLFGSCVIIFYILTN